MEANSDSHHLRKQIFLKRGLKSLLIFVRELFPWPFSSIAKTVKNSAFLEVDKSERLLGKKKLFLIPSHFCNPSKS